MNTTNTAETAAIFSKLTAQAEQIIDLVRAPSVLMHCVPRPGIEIATKSQIDGTGFKVELEHSTERGYFLRVELHSASVESMKELLNQVRDAAKVIGAKLTTRKHRNRDGSLYSITERYFENDPFCQVADYHAEIKLWA